MISYQLAIISGFSIGMLGSLHCIGMCGPLALSLPINSLSSKRKLVSILAYNVGRAIAYSFIGLLFGLVGVGFHFFKLQQYLSIGAGVLLLLFVFSIQSNVFKINFFSRLSLLVKQKLSAFLKSEKTILNFFYIGIANGFLPCGLVYAALIPAITYGTIIKTGVSMFAFGLGTMPFMVVTMLAGKFISLPIRNVMAKLSPYILASIAILLILRGLNLNAPMLSPKVVKGEVISCHK